MTPEKEETMEQATKKLHRVALEFEPDSPPRMKLIHPNGACERATACGECGKRIGDPATPDCEVCPDGVEDCWLEGWVEQYTAEEVLAGPVEFPVSPECDGESLILHVAAESPPNVLTPEEAQLLARFVSPPECISAAEVGACKEIARRLSAWAEENDRA